MSMIELELICAAIGFLFIGGFVGIKIGYEAGYNFGFAEGLKS